MVDYVKRARGTGAIDPDEEILAACNFTPSPFSVQNAGMTGGLIAGGLAGMAIGAAWDRYREKKDADEGADQELPALVIRPEHDTALHPNGTLIAVTTKRLIGWRIAGLGKPRVMILDIALDRVDEVVWDEADAKMLRGKPASTLVWVGVDESVLPMSAISAGPNRKHVQGVIEALEARLPGRVRRFSAG
jgi:hypothetical protein